ncbi:hypothetical protein GIB67_000941 [Kingdonia uniflora]|uniref:Uncharacterized protein n=1 Tax=Kingdonia uniflora TaxID=39325 RepID=A0A7J7MG55_9MAGN|nr:hypothetical protein GIB67_000941 [Kingdonia uniflora]
MLLSSDTMEEKREIEVGVDMEEQEHQQEEDYSRRIPPWKKQITVRGLIASFIIGVIYSVIVMKLNLTTGLVPNLNVSAALLAFVLIRSWTKLLEKAGIVSTPFTRQENTVIQTCAVACYSISVGGGFGSYLLGLNKKTYEQVGIATEGNSPGSYKEPGVGWMTGFLFVTSFVGLLALVPLRKVISVHFIFTNIMIIDYKLTYPSGTATAVLINGFHTTQGDQNAKYYSNFPILETSPWVCQVLFIQFSLGFIPVVLFGRRAMWVFTISYFRIESLEANILLRLQYDLHWSRDDLFPPSELIFASWGCTVMGDYVAVDTWTKGRLVSRVSIRKQYEKSDRLQDSKDHPLDELHRNELFMRESIPIWVACVGYVIFSIISIIVIPLMFPQLKWYYVVVAYILAPSLGFCNAYGAGLTDMNMAYNYGKVALFILAALAGKNDGVVAGLVGCGLIKSIVSISSDLMHDFKSGHLTLTSPRSMLLSQAVGTAMGCVVAPLIFFLFYKAFDIGNPEGEFKAPYAIIYRNMAILGVEGFSALPHHCLQLCYGFFSFAVVANLARDLSPANIGKFVPLPMAMAVPFLVGANFAIDMCMGSLVVFAWHKLNSNKASLMVPAVASGLICGDGLWILPSSILALAKINPPICMRFLPTQ